MGPWDPMLREQVAQTMPGQGRAGKTREVKERGRMGSKKPRT